MCDFGVEEGRFLVWVSVCVCVCAAEKLTDYTCVGRDASSASSSPTTSPPCPPRVSSSMGLRTTRSQTHTDTDTDTGHRHRHMIQRDDSIREGQTALFCPPREHLARTLNSSTRDSQWREQQEDAPEAVLALRGARVGHVPPRHHPENNDKQLWGRGR